MATARSGRAVLEAERGPKRDVVVLNAAAALWIADVSPNLEQCAAIAIEAIENGKAKQVVRQLGEMTRAES